MALIITATETAKLPIKGTNIELESIYARINWNAPIQGKSIQYGLVPFINKLFYKNNNPVMINFVGASGFIALQENDEQSLQFVHEKIKEQLESLGFTVIIQL